MIYILLPAYNEEQGIAVVLRRLVQITSDHPETFKIIVVDDGSVDKTLEAVQVFEKDLDIKTISFGENRGVAEVFRAGLTFVCENSTDPDNDICISLDSDNTMDARRIPDMIQAVRDGQDIVIASRFEKSGRMVGCTWPRYLNSIGLSVLMRSIVRLPSVKDYSIFYRAYRVSLIKKGFAKYGDDILAGQGFAAIGGLLIKLGRLTPNIQEIPLVLRYGKKRGSSGIKIMKTIQGYLRLISDFIRTNRFEK